MEDAVRAHFDLYLAGHTHGGQIALPFYGALITYSRYDKKYEAGLYREGSTTLYVNRGLGLAHEPMPEARFWARPEVTVIDLVGAPE
jgi:predicted MPP superfamily phosphohydrolase